MNLMFWFLFFVVLICAAAIGCYICLEFVLPRALESRREQSIENLKEEFRRAREPKDVK